MFYTGRANHFEFSATSNALGRRFERDIFTEFVLYLNGGK
jgi:hypothetical protein